MANLKSSDALWSVSFYKGGKVVGHMKYVKDVAYCVKWFTNKKPKVDFQVFRVFERTGGAYIGTFNASDWYLEKPLKAERRNGAWK